MGLWIRGKGWRGCYELGNPVASHFHILKYTDLLRVKAFFNGSFVSFECFWFYFCGGGDGGFFECFYVVLL